MPKAFAAALIELYSVEIFVVKSVTRTTTDFGSAKDNFNLCSSDLDKPKEFLLILALASTVCFKPSQGELGFCDKLYSSAGPQGGRFN